jgi:D-beta-D-heptose 7-phosphate kinase/D-beta-D-heptose 1-phosphate adenosyltransferase
LDETVMLGGAGNVVANLRALGCPVSFLGITGCDADSGLLEQLLTRCGASHSLLQSERWTTSVKTRFVSDNHHLLRFDKETVGSLTPEEEASLLEKLEQKQADYDVVLLSDYAKGLLSPAFTQRVMSRCKACGKPVMVDPKGSDYRKYQGAFLVKPNCKELEQVSHVRLDPKAPEFIPTVAHYAERLAKTADIEHVIVTLGNKGMLHVCRGDASGAYTHLPTVAKEVFDVSGAGDTSFAALGASIAVQATVSDAIRIANIASGIVVGKLGTATVDPAALIDYLHAQSPEPEVPHGKILPLGEALKYLQGAKTAGKVVGLTNGCFDLLHCGHLHSLSQAKKLCDILVVALNSDVSVKRLKGESRPIQDERTRSEVLAALECVDLVVLFDDATAAEVIQALRPDVIAKEGYTLDQWPEARLVQSYGGQAVTLKRLEGYSTSVLIKKMCQS